MKLLKSERIPVMFDPKLLNEVDEFRFENKISTRAATIRHLIVLGMNKEETKKADARVY